MGPVDEQGHPHVIVDLCRREEVKRRQTEAAGFDDSLLLRQGVGEWLVRFAPLVRPRVEARFIDRVAQQNREMFDKPDLSDFLFGADRTSLARVSGPLTVSQGHRCFYCGDRLSGSIQVDHFLPWSRRHHDALDNLVAAHGRCNGAKSATLAATGHLERWLRRFDSDSEAAAGVDDVASETRWTRNPTRTLGMARASYLWLPPATQLWVRDREYVQADNKRLQELLTSAA